MLPGETILGGAVEPDGDPHVSAFQVLSTPAGWYVGTTYTHCSGPKRCAACVEEGCPGMVEPNSRETGYFKSYADAEAALKKFQATGELPEKRTSDYQPGKLTITKLGGA